MGQSVGSRISTSVNLGCSMYALSAFRSLVMWGFLFSVAIIFFFAFELVSEPGLLGMSLTTLGEVPKSVFRFSRVAVGEFRTSSFLKCVVRKLTVDQNGGSDQLFLSQKTENELVEILATATIKKR